MFKDIEKECFWNCNRFGENAEKDCPGFDSFSCRCNCDYREYSWDLLEQENDEE